MKRRKAAAALMRTTQGELVGPLSISDKISMDDIRLARTIENQRITIGDLQRVLDILRGEELEVRIAAKLGMNVTIVTSTDTHQRRLPFQQVEETSGGAAPLSTGEIKVFLSDMRKDVPQIFC